MLYYVYYSPQTKLLEGNIFTPVCDSVHTGGGVHGEGDAWQRGYVWQTGRVHDKEGHVWQGGMHGGRGVHGKGVCMARGQERACVHERQPLKRAVCILLECILVILWFPIVCKKLKFSYRYL